MFLLLIKFFKTNTLEDFIMARCPKSIYDIERIEREYFRGKYGTSY